MTPPRFLQIAIVAVLISTSGQAVATPADTVITNAVVYTGPQQRAQAIAIKAGRITHLGNNTDVQAHIGAETEIINARQAFVLPGFVDNHNHVFEAASEAGGNCEVAPDTGVEELVPQLEACASIRDGEGWLIGYGFTIDAILDYPDHLTPLAVLDQVFPDRPVILMEQTSHAMWVNSVALELANIDIHSPQPQGGEILRDTASDRLNGILLDNAGDMVMELASNSLNNAFEENYQGLMNGLYEAARHGITTIGDGRLYWKRGWLEVWEEVEAREELTARVSLRPWIYPQDPLGPQLAFLRQARRVDGGLLRIDQVKMYSDGIIVNGTAKTLAPYLRTYMQHGNDGLYYIPPERMASLLQALATLGYGAHIHAIGDGAVKASLDAIEALGKGRQPLDYTLTHVEMVAPEDIARFAQLGVTADYQVGSDYIANHDHQWAVPYLGRARAHALMPMRAIYETGANISLSSDWNVHSLNPLVSIANSLVMGTRGLPDINSAIAAYTRNAAKSMGLDDITGSLAVGKSADLVMLDRDITRLQPADIRNAEFLLTMLAGEIVYDRKETGN